MTVLVAWLWQGTAIAMGTAVLLRLARRQSAATRYLVWWMALVAIVLLPVAHLLPSSGTSAGPASVILPVHTDPVLILPAPPDWLGACLLGAWFGMVLVGIGRIAHGTLAVLRLKRLARPVEPHVAQSLQAWRDYAQGRRAATLCVAEGAAAASTLGLFGRPTIVVSQALVDSLDQSALDQVVLHEQAHLSRYDDWTKLLQALLSTFCGLHPAVHFIASRLDIERETACDAVVVARTGNAARYAACLADVADTMGQSITHRTWNVAPSALGSGTLLVRVQRLLDLRQKPLAGVRAFDAIVAGLLLLVTLDAAPYTARSVLVFEAQTVLQVRRRASTLLARAAMPNTFALHLPINEPTVLTVTASSSRPTGSHRRAPVRADETLRSTLGAYQTAQARSADDDSRQHDQATAGHEPEPLASRPLTDVSFAPHRFSNDGLQQNGQAANLEVDATVPVRSDWNAIGDVSVALGRTVGRLSTSTGNGTRRASVAVGGWFGRAGKAVAGSF